MRAAAPAFLAIAALVLAGCGSGGSKVDVSKLPKLVLQPDDLPAVFNRFDEGRQVQADAAPGPEGDPHRYGREDGWKARYHRGGSSKTAGPIVVESRADLFWDAGGAREDLGAYRDRLRVGMGFREVDAAQVGEESLATTRLQRSSPPVRYYTIAWREGNVSASVSVNGFEGKLTLTDALALARAQERRIARSRG